MSRQIDALYELAFREKAFAATVELQWFLTEQVEEEKSAREIVAKFRLVGNDPSSLLDLDRELGSRSGADVARAAATRSAVRARRWSRGPPVAGVLRLAPEVHRRDAVDAADRAVRRARLRASGTRARCRPSCRCGAARRGSRAAASSSGPGRSRRRRSSARPARHRQVFGLPSARFSWKPRIPE